MTSQTEERAFPRKCFPRHRWGSRASGSSVRRPMPHTESKGMASAKTFVPVLRRWYFVVGFCENLAKLPAPTAYSRTRSQTALSKLRTPNALVRARVWRRHNELHGAAVLDNTSLPYHHKLLRARIRHVVDDKREGDHCEKHEGGCQNSTTCSFEYSSLGSKTDGAEPSVSMGGRQRTTPRTLGPWCTRRVRSHGSWPGVTIAHGRKMAKTVLVRPPIFSAKNPGGGGL